MQLAQGDNHSIHVRDGIAICKVWSRPDLSAEHGARNAEEMVATLTSMVARPGSPYSGLVFDVRSGPQVFGPKTRATLSVLFERAKNAGVPVGVLVGDSAIQSLQFRSLCQEVGSHAELFSDEITAMAWLKAPPSRRRGS